MIIVSPLICAIFNLYATFQEHLQEHTLMLQCMRYGITDLMPLFLALPNRKQVISPQLAKALSRLTLGEVWAARTYLENSRIVALEKHKSLLISALDAAALKIIPREPEYARPYRGRRRVLSFDLFLFAIHFHEDEPLAAIDPIVDANL